MTSRNDDRLLPCPFCGEKQIFLNDPNPDGYRYGSINCPACLVVMPGEVSSQDELIGCWNSRAAASAEPVAWRNAVYNAALIELETRHPIPTTTLLATKIADRIASLAAPVPASVREAPTIDDVPSCGQENDFRRAR